nr:cytospin-A [Drosophila bipectinata]
MSEKYVESQENIDPEKDENSLVLKKCSKIMRELYLILPWDNDGVEMDQHIQNTYQYKLSSVLVELEKMAKNPSKSPRPQQALPKAVNTDELADLRARFKKLDAIQKLQDVSHKLLGLKEAISDQNAEILTRKNSEEMVDKEKSDSADIKNRLAHTEHKLKSANEIIAHTEHKLESANEIIRKLKDANKTLQKSYMAIQRDHTYKRDPIPDKTQLSKKALKTSSAMKVVRKELVPETIRVLKQQLIYAQEELTQNKKIVSEIKRDISNLCYSNTKMSSSTNKKIAYKTSFKSLKHTGEETMRVIDDTLKALQYHKQLKFPACEIKWKVVCRSLQNNLLAVQTRPEMRWDKISLTSKDCSRSVVSNVSSFSIFDGKTFGDRRLWALKWCKEKIRPYGVPMYEFSESWTSGRALCALIHAYRPELIAPKYLRRTGPVETLEFGVDVAKGLGVCSPIDLMDECTREKPNYERVLEFVQELRRCLEALP